MTARNLAFTHLTLHKSFIFEVAYESCRFRDQLDNVRKKRQQHFSRKVSRSMRQIEKRYNVSKNRAE